MERDGARQVNNPARVPDTLTAIDGPQAGQRRIIHPVAMPVGVDTKEPTMARTSIDQQTFEVPEDGVFTDHRGSPIAFRKGDRIPLTRAAQFAAFNASLEGEQLSGITAARAEGPAPENRAEPAPENRSTRKTTKKSDD